ncbi:MAG: hypothetical protein HW421_1451 [Ignavibacteria bacterium]|nr:hypothetical protein [Ignavibacteria bacterium]
MKKQINWSEEKNLILKQERHISFELVAEKIKNGDIIDDIIHPNSEKYYNQKIFVIEIDDYIYLVPYVEDENEIFLKTIYPSRNFTKIYLGE